MDKFKNKISDFFWNIKKTYLRGKGFVVRANHVDEGFEDYDIFGLYHQTYLINYSAPMEIISLLNINQHKDSDKHIILTSFINMNSNKATATYFAYSYTSPEAHQAHMVGVSIASNIVNEVLKEYAKL